MTDNSIDTSAIEGLDEELAAMGAVGAALRGLSQEGRTRVIRWAADLFGVAVAKGDRRPAGGGSDRDADDHADDDDEAAPTTFAEFADLYDHVKPRDGGERLLAAAYWEQVIGGKGRFGAREVNGHLKNLGRQVDGIAKRFQRLIEREPALVLQLKKAGTSRQAQKDYKLSVAGIKTMEEAIRVGRIEFPTDD